MNRILLLLGVASLLAGCAGQEAPQVSFPPTTTLTSASARCQPDGRCRCRPLDSLGDQSEEAIPAGRKRFELRLPKTTSALWVAVEGQGHFYKPPERIQPVCFYLDLPPGEHQLTVHGVLKNREVGLQTGLQIFEYGAKEGPHWYRSLDFVCGGLSKCTQDGMAGWLAFQRKLPRGVLDPCGSTMIRKVRLQGVRPERHLPEYEELTLSLTLKIYAFETYRQPGSSECVAPIKNR